MSDQGHKEEGKRGLGRELGKGQTPLIIKVPVTTTGPMGRLPIGVNRRLVWMVYIN